MRTRNMTPQPSVEILNLHCAHCSKPLQIVWSNGVVDDQYHVLIADCVFCVECFDDMIEEMNNAGPAF